MKPRPDLKIVVSNAPVPAALPLLPPEQAELPFALVNGEPLLAAAAGSVHPAAGTGGVS